MQVLASSGVIVPGHDLDTAIDWYCKSFRVQLDDVTQHTDTKTGAVTHKARLMGQGRNAMEVIEAVPPPQLAHWRLPTGYATFGTDDVQGAYERLSDAARWCGAPQRIQTGEMAGSMSVAGLDPWGNMVSLWCGVCRWSGPTPRKD